MTHMEITRRKFVVSTAAAGGGMMLGFYMPAQAANRVADRPWESPTQKDGQEVNAWIVIDPEGTLIYAGAITDDRNFDKDDKATNYVINAVRSSVSGIDVAPGTVRPWVPLRSPWSPTAANSACSPPTCSSS